jgi:hypothetical protein
MDGISSLIDDVLGPPPPRGRRKAGPHAAVVRELTQEDIRRLWEMPEGALSSKVRPLLKLRHSHHMLARLVAQGTREGEISLVTGYSLPYITNIKTDPAFGELVSYYKSQVSEVYLDVHARLAVLGLDSVDELQDRLATAPDEFTTRELMELAALGLDRAGYAPKQSQAGGGAGSVLTPEVLMSIKVEVSRRQNGTLRNLAADNSGPPLGPVIEGDSTQAAKAEGLESQGPHVPAEGGEVPKP